MRQALLRVADRQRVEAVGAGDAPHAPVRPHVAHRHDGREALAVEEALHAVAAGGIAVRHTEAVEIRTATGIDFARIDAAKLGYEVVEHVGTEKAMHVVLARKAGEKS